MNECMKKLQYCLQKSCFTEGFECVLYLMTFASVIPFIPMELLSNNLYRIKHYRNKGDLSNLLLSRKNPLILLSFQ